MFLTEDCDYLNPMYMRVPSQLKVTTIMLNPAHMAELREIAESEPGQTPSGLVRLAIAEYLRRAARRKRYAK
jgi:hypothetical protein